MNHLLYLFLFSHTANANPLVQYAQGDFSCRDSEDEIKNKEERALKKTLASYPSLIRPIIASSLRGKFHMCQKYKLSTDQDEMMLKCDERPTVAVQLNGTPTQYITEKGTMSVVAEVQNNTITQDFQAKSGGLLIQYAFYDKRLEVTKTLYSPYLRESLTLQTDYLLQESLYTQQ